MGEVVGRSWWFAIVLTAIAVGLACTNSNDATTQSSATSGPPNVTSTRAAASVGDASLSEWAESFCRVIVGWSELSGPLETPEELVVYTDEQTAIADQAPAYLEATREALASLEQIDPPDAASSFHDAAVAFLRGNLEALEKHLPEVTDASTVFDYADAIRATENAQADAAAPYRAENAAADPAILGALAEAPTCGLSGDGRSTGTSVGDADIASEIEGSLLDFDDMLGGAWRFAEFGEAEYGLSAIENTACIAELATTGNRPLRALATTEPNALGGRLLFNGALGNDGTQILSEIWAFAEADDATETFAAVRAELDSEDSLACLEERTLSSNPTSGRDISRSSPTFELNNSFAFAVDVRDAIGGQVFESHIEVHFVQRGRFVGMVVAWDHAPARLWQTDGERLLMLFEQRLSEAR